MYESSRGSAFGTLLGTHRQQAFLAACCLHRHKTNLLYWNNRTSHPSLMGKGGDSGIGEILSAKTTTTASRPDNAAAAPLPGPGRPVIPVIPVDPPKAVGTAG
ncbi:hypothetical protein THAOC_00798, partial [Thalassiosira oceanica]